ncbi:hypothetical protein, partial [Brevibacillus porteri]|uniref:hypothetical protein n=1 Tax=Brevibacillus porteri TaxID=2126350 RepID=UPI002E1F6376|nr:hypothetical protein [Brevibacillus porteri]
MNAESYDDFEWYEKINATLVMSDKIERCKNVRNLVIHKLQDSDKKTDVNQVDYDIFSTFFFDSFDHL